MTSGSISWRIQSYQEDYVSRGRNDAANGTSSHSEFFASADDGDAFVCAQASLRNALKYLAAKQRVQSTMILRRDTGSILHVDGQIAASTTAATATPPLDSAASSSQQRAEPPESHGADPNETADKVVSGVKVNVEAGDSSKAQKLAELAWRFASVAGEVAVVLEGEEKIGLLRLRTGKHEVIIVPDDTYLLVVVSDP